MNWLTPDTSPGPAETGQNGNQMDIENQLHHTRITFKNSPVKGTLAKVLKLFPKANPEMVSGPHYACDGKQKQDVRYYVPHH